MSIQRVVARTVYDSRGNPTVEVDLFTAIGMFRSSVPSGASTGAHEATELRDGDMSKWQGKGVLQAVNNVNSILGPAVMGKDPTDQVEIDSLMCNLDGTKSKSKFGANAILAVSLAVARAGAGQKGVPLWQHLGSLAGNSNFVLPTPCFNVINGGVHAGNELAQQEFLVLPTGATTYSEGLQWATEVYHSLKTIIRQRFGISATNVGDEGGFAPPVHNGDEALDLIEQAIEAAGHKGHMMLAFDSAASEFYENGLYDLDFKKAEGRAASRKLSGSHLGKVYDELLKGRSIAFVEDPFAEDDWEPAKAFTAAYDIEVIGDDMLCTNPTLIKKAIEEKAVNSLLLKVNQIGTVTEAIEATRLAKEAGWGVLTSHRSGETADDFIADLSVGLATGHMKSGAPARGERLAKYNRLLRIEEELVAAGKKAKYAGSNFRYVAWEKSE